MGLSLVYDFAMFCSYSLSLSKPPAVTLTLNQFDLIEVDMLFKYR